jgi:hypothetical protein
LTDIFLVANRFAAVRRLPAEPALRVSHWRQIANGKAMECVFDTIPGPYNRPAVLIVPPSLSKPISSSRQPRLQSGLRTGTTTARYFARFVLALSYWPKPAYLQAVRRPRIGPILTSSCDVFPIFVSMVTSSSLKMGT